MINFLFQTTISEPIKAIESYFTKINTPPWVFFTFF